jgi:predicted DNA-binding ribbon-helix-helix protein
VAFGARLKREVTMKSAIAKRSIVLNQHKTSISLEDDFWNCLRAIADEKKMKLTSLLLQIDNDRNNANLSSAIRVFVFNEMRAQRATQSALTGVGAAGHWPIEANAASPVAEQRNS